MINQILFAFGTLFAIVNPFSTSLVFMKMTHGMSNQERKSIALKSSVTAFIALTVFLLLGQYVLLFFGVTIYAFRVAGGLYLLKIGFDMLSPQLRKKPDHYASEHDSIAIIPLAIPLLAGPGALTSVLVLGAEIPVVVVLVAIFAVCVVSWFILNQTKHIQKILKNTGTSVVERLMGIIVLVVAIQFILNGITEYIALL